MSFPITVEEVEAAYRELEIRPVSGAWANYYQEQGDSRKCACALSVVLAKRTSFANAVTINDSDNDVAFVADQLGITKYQVDGYIAGFDHGASWGPSGFYSPDYLEAFAAGNAARERMNPIDYDSLLHE